MNAKAHFPILLSAALLLAIGAAGPSRAGKQESNMPAYYDTHTSTISVVELSQKSAKFILEHNKSLNEKKKTSSVRTRGIQAGNASWGSLRNAYLERVTVHPEGVR